MALQKPRIPGAAAPVAVPAKPNGAPAAPAAAPADPGALAAALGIVSNHDPAHQAGLKVGLWGDYGTLKTTYLLSFPGVFVLNFDQQTSTIRGQAFNVPYIQVRDFAHMKQLEQLIAQRQLTALVRTIPGFEDYTVQTIGVDSSSSQGEMIAAECDRLMRQGTFSTKSGNDDMQKWFAKKLALHNEWLKAVGEASQYLAGRDHYHVVTTMHEKIKWDERGNIVEVRAAIDGDIGRRIFGKQDANFYCEKDSPIVEATGKVMRAGGELASPKPTVWTIPFDKWHKPVLDRIGRPGGRFKVLPASFTPPPIDQGGLWAALCEYWGIEDRESI